MEIQVILHTAIQFPLMLMMCMTFITTHQLKDVILVGWSMGAFVVWEYLKQFGQENVKGNIIVDEMASDFKWPDFPIGAFDLPALISLMQGIQLDRTSTLENFIPLMFKDELTEEDKHWVMKEVTKMPESDGQCYFV